MRVIHTYVYNQNIIWKELMYAQYLSAILAKKHYGNITFVTTPELSKLIKTLELPYDEIITGVTDNSDFDSWTIPKLKTFSHFKEPFLHIDTDAFIFDKINFENQFECPIIFAHPDLPYEEKHITNVLVELTRFINNTYDLNETGHIYNALGTTYTKLFLQLFNSHDKNLIKNLDFASIPNSSIAYVKDFELFKEATLLALKHYYEHKTQIDLHDQGGTYVEQLMIHQNLRMLSENYKMYSSDNEHLLYKKWPFRKLNNYQAETTSINSINFPYDWEIINRCDHCNMGKAKKISIKDKLDIVNLFDYNFEGFLHVTYHKWSDMFQAIIIDKLRKEIGDDGILKIHNYYKGIYPTYKLPIKSDGEKLYEELTGFKFDKPKNMF
jgi:hypothetical protein